MSDTIDSSSNDSIYSFVRSFVCLFIHSGTFLDMRTCTSTVSKTIAFIVK